MFFFSTIDTKDGSSSQIFGTFFVDAMGRRSKSFEWLEAAGYTKVPKQEVAANLAYVSATLRGVVYPGESRFIMVHSMFPITFYLAVC